MRITRPLFGGAVALWFAGPTNASVWLSSRRDLVVAPRSLSRATKKNKLANAVVSLPRGGGSIPRVDPDVAGKLLITVHLAAGSIWVLAPQRMMDIFGASKTTAYEFIMESYGMLILSSGIMAYALLIQGASTNTAIGSAFVSLAAFTFGMILNGKGGKLGFHRGPDWVNLFLQSLAAHALLTDQDYASNLVKVISYSGFLNGVACILATDKLLSLSGLEDEKLKKDAQFLAQIHLLGYSLLAFATMTLLLLNGQDPLTAFAYKSLFHLLAEVVGIFISKDIVKLGLNKFAIYGFMVLFMVTCGSILFPRSEEL